MITERTPGVYELLGKLEDVSYSNNFMFGHQNAGHIGVSIKEHDGTESDVKNLVGKHPKVVGIDTLSFFGYEGTMDQLVKVTKQLHKEGCIITLSSHMPNFSLGGDDYYDYSPNFTDGDIGRRIMPGGDLNPKFLRFLDHIAKFVNECIDVDGEPIPMIFRPFHEDNGDWFWWGRKHLPDEDYKKLFRYTVDYLQGEKGVKSLAYSYSPNGFFSSEEDYMKRYPGDDYVDVLGMDIYRDHPSSDDKFFEKLKTSLQYIFECSMQHGKTYAITEIGMRVLDTPEGYYEGLSPSHNVIKNFYTELLSSLSSYEAGSRCAYMLAWANFSDQQFWVPYQIVGDNGEVKFRHEMCDDFEAFCKDTRIILAD
ncbi:MAG: glycoside hydrolase family 26 protein [Saccharofermentans sp.]|nr:glycoside hydrolase family 26 protein [Saccharofermentans sp.]